MKATVIITKSFDNGKEFTKEWTMGDFAEFFKEEGEYLDRLSGITEREGRSGDGFIVTYAVKVEK